MTTATQNQNGTNGQAKRADVYTVHTSDQPNPSHHPVNRIVLEVTPDGAQVVPADDSPSNDQAAPEIDLWEDFDTGQPSEADAPPIRDQISEAFYHVALGASCTLPTLLAETRKRGIPDAEVKRVIQAEEFHGINGEGFRCLRNDVGIGYVAENLCIEGTVASAAELFAEMEKPSASTEAKGLEAGTPAADDLPPMGDTVPASKTLPSDEGKVSEADPYLLSERLRERGEKLTPAEAAILDAAQTIRAKFVTGQPVHLRTLQRVTVRFSEACPMNVEFRAAIASLTRHGLCERVSGTITLFRLVRHLGDIHATKLTRFSALGVTPRQEQLLLCCEHCCSVGFSTRNVAARCAVKWLMMERHNLTKGQVKQTIRELLRAGILEHLQGRGSNALRLTPAAVLVVQKECETLSEAKRVLALREGDTKGAHSMSIPAVTAAEAHSGLQTALRYLSGVLRRKSA